MVKQQNNYSIETKVNKGQNQQGETSAKINASTPYDLTENRLTAFGGLFALVKFFDAVNFENLFESKFIKPKRRPKLGCFKMFY